MTTFAMFVLVVLGLAAVIQRADSVCCLVKAENRCADCTEGTPYCSYGKCNIFGCACASPCREDCGSVIESEPKSFFFLTRKIVTCVCSNGKRDSKDVVFDDMDASDDGKIDSKEFDLDLQ